MDAGPDPPARRPLPKRPRPDRPRLNLLAWLHSTLEPKRRLRLPEGEVSAFVTSIADRLLAGALDDGSSVTGRSLKEFFTRAGREASLDFLRKRHLTPDVAVWLHDAARRGRAGQLQDEGASPRIPKIGRGYDHPNWEPRRGRGGDRYTIDVRRLEIPEVLSKEAALAKYKRTFATPYEPEECNQLHDGSSGVRERWDQHATGHRTVLELVDKNKTDDDGNALVVARIVGGGVAGVDISRLQVLAPRAPEIMKTDFAQVRSSGPGRGQVANIGLRNRVGGDERGHAHWGKIGPYAHKPEQKEAHGELLANAAFLANAMIAADAPYNAFEQERAREQLASRCWIGLAGAPEPLTPTYPAATVGNRACSPQHIDKFDVLGGLFTQL